MDERLRRRSYLGADGFRPTAADAAGFARFGGGAPRQRFESLGRWFRHVGSFAEAERARWPSEG